MIPLSSSLKELDDHEESPVVKKVVKVMKIHNVIYHIFAILTLFFATENSLYNPFILDDNTKIVNNFDIRKLSNIPWSLVYPYAGNSIF
jgi:hypothetical protein